MPIPPRLLAHLRRWKERKIIARHFVEFNGEGVSSVKTAFKRAVTPAKLGPAFRRIRYGTPRQRGCCRTVPTHGKPPVSRHERRNIVGVYGHHHPDHLKDAVAKMTAKPIASASPQKRTEKKKTNVVKIQ